MDLLFLPSLQHMSAVKIAVLLFIDKDIGSVLEVEYKQPSAVCCFDRDKIDLWNLIHTKAADKLSCLPNSLKTKVFKCLRPFQWETSRWISDHTCVMGLPYTDCYHTYKNILCWKAEGTIDRIKTAKKLVQDRKIDLETRLVIACIYFLEDEVLALWYGEKELDIKSITHNKSNLAVRFWIKRLKETSWRKTPWNSMVDSHFKNAAFLQSDVKLRVSSFFQYLSWEGKKNYFDDLCSLKTHDDDCRLCFQAMNQTERMELISEDPELVLKLCLDWPFQSLFIDRANQLWGKMTASAFESLIYPNFIEFHILEGFEDFDYVGLLKEFWHKSPDSFKNVVKKDKKLFQLIELTLTYDEKNALLSLPETLDEFIHPLFHCKIKYS